MKRKTKTKKKQGKNRTRRRAAGTHAKRAAPSKSPLNRRKTSGRTHSNIPEHKHRKHNLDSIILVTSITDTPGFARVHWHYNLQARCKRSFCLYPTTARFHVKPGVHQVQRGGGTHQTKNESTKKQIVPNISCPRGIPRTFDEYPCVFGSSERRHPKEKNERSELCATQG